LFVALWLLLWAADPNQAIDLLKKGLTALQQGQLQEARTTLEEASKADDHNPYVWISLAETYLRLNQPEQAESAAAKAQNAGNSNPVITHAVSLFYFKLADGLLHKEDFTRAADVLSTGLKTDPQNAQLVLALGVARYGQRRFDEAISEFLKVIQIDSSIEQPYIFLAKMLDQAGPHMDEIRKDCEAWYAAQPADPKSSFVLAKVLLMSDPRSERAETLLRKSLEQDANNWEAHYQLGVLLTNRRDFAGAAPELLKSIELQPNQPMPHYHLARVYDRLGQADKAKEQREIHQRLTAAAPSRQ
jgi:tetratricopeptide (TPR) repeat protein